MNKKCQVFTPKNNVLELLDRIGYTKNLFGYKVIENACGDGNILIEIVKRYILSCLNMGLNIDTIKQGLENDIYGVEIDKIHYNKCILNLELVASYYGIYGVKWNILNVDILKTPLKVKFDFVIGNPPYIKYRDLDEETRSFLKEYFQSCSSGKFDYCYAFIEASLNCLNEKGKLAYLIPSSIFKNVFGQELRKIILPHVTKIIDYTTQKIFQKALTSSAILICDKNANQDYIEYYDVTNDKTSHVLKINLINKWVFSSQLQNTSKQKFGDFFTASISIATLFNKAYVLKKYTIEEKYIIVGDFKIEKSIVREGVSPRTLNYNKSELILFPYHYENNSLVRYTSQDFENKFVEATKYLKSFSEELSKRKADKSVEWFEYGRTQALAHLNQPKLLLSTVITNKVKVYELTEECIPYSGIYIISKGDLPLSQAKKILESEAFYKYVQGIGINANGSSFRITSSDINNFEF